MQKNLSHAQLELLELKVWFTYFKSGLVLRICFLINMFKAMVFLWVSLWLHPTGFITQGTI